MWRLGKRTLVVALLFVATSALVGGAVVAAASSSSKMFWAQSSPVESATAPVAGTPTPSSPPSTTAPPSSPKTAPEATTPPALPSASAAPKPSKDASITYTVKRGDTLTGIAAWFKQRGFQDLYEANRSVIGNNPDLIRPGQRITISKGVMKVSPP